MKKFIKENKSYIKSISLVLLSEAFIYFCIKTIIKDYNILTPKINFPVISFFSIIYNSWYPFLFLIAYTIFKKDETTYKKYIYTIIIGAILAEITFITYPTMVIRPDIVYDAYLSVKKEHSKVIYLTPQGKTLNQEKVQELAKSDHIILLCGHYEGIDQRVITLTHLQSTVYHQYIVYFVS